MRCIIVLLNFLFDGIFCRKKLNECENFVCFEFVEVAEINENALDTTHVFIEAFFILNDG